jgi:hypothetical protein
VSCADSAVRRRSDRYTGPTNLDVDWALEAAADPRCVVHDPDPKSEADSPTRPARHADDAAIAADVRRVREEYADEEADAAKREAAENAAALDVSLSLRISRDLDEALKRRSSEE